MTEQTGAAVPENGGESTPEVEAPRALNPLAALTLVLVFPHRTFERLRERPHWVLPLLFIIAAVVAKSLLALESGVLDRVLESEAFLTGADIEEVRSGAPVAFVASGLIGVPVILLVQSLFYMVAGAVYGGRVRFVTALSAIGHASMPVGVGALAAAALIPVTHSADLGADLSRLVDPTVHPFLWGLARELGVIPLWFYALAAIAARPIFRLPRRRAWMAAGTFVIAHVVIMSYLGIGQARSQIDPHEGWSSAEVQGIVVHFPEGTRDEVATAVGAAAACASARADSIVGGYGGRIDCYVYPSRGEKERVTGNPDVAHGVTWASVVHVAGENRPEAALAREVAQVAGAQTLGKMYNPFIRDGLAVFAGADWRGRPVIEAARELHSATPLPGLADLIDPTTHARIDSEVSRPAAGAFTAFLMRELGEGAYRDLYGRVARTRAPVAASLEGAFGDSLRAIEASWISFIEADEDGASTADTH